MCRLTRLDSRWQFMHLCPSVVSTPQKHCFKGFQATILFSFSLIGHVVGLNVPSHFKTQRNAP
jgi:hypothetical protein